MAEHASIGGFDLSAGPDVVGMEGEAQPVHIRWLPTGELMYYIPKEGAEPKPCTISVVGNQSDHFKRVNESIITRSLKRRGQPVTGQLVGAQALEQVAGCATAWDGWTDKGKGIPFSKENVMRLLQKYPFIQDQLEDAMKDHELFFKKPSGS